MAWVGFARSGGKKRPPSSPQLDRYVKIFKNSFLTPLMRDVNRSQRDMIPPIAAF